jgi:tetratricopeptide (TPR) repeat protein
MTALGRCVAGVLLAASLVAAACAPKIVPPPVVTTPRFPDFVRPIVPPAMAEGAAAINASRGWAYLQTGDLRTAEHEFSAALKNDPKFYPAETLLGYVEMARNEPKAALPHFDRALAADTADFAALNGRAQALLSLGREADALAALQLVLAVDPNQPDIRRRIDVLTFRLSEQSIARARQAVVAGRLDEAVQAYTTAIAASPDSPFLYRELGAIEKQQGRVDEALAHFRKAVALDATDTRSLVQIGDILAAQNDFEAAIQSYSEAAALEPGDEIERKIEDMRARVALARLPAEYREIDQATQITRADLAALIGIRLGRLIQAGERTDTLITDVRNNWAQAWIMAVARAGVMEPFANHAFQPRAVVRRAELAQTVARLLARVGSLRPGSAKAWESARLRFSDLAPTHLAYPAASVAVAAGVLKTAPDTAFQPSRPVTGPEAIDAIAKLESLAGLK